MDRLCALCVLRGSFRETRAKITDFKQALIPWAWPPSPRRTQSFPQNLCALCGEGQRDGDENKP